MVRRGDAMTVDRDHLEADPIATDDYLRGQREEEEALVKKRNATDLIYKTTMRPAPAPEPSPAPTLVAVDDVWMDAIAEFVVRFTERELAPRDKEITALKSELAELRAQVKTLTELLVKKHGA